MVRLHAARTGLERGAVEGEGREGEGREGKGRGSGLDGTTAHFFVCQRTRPPAESAEPCVLRRVAQGVDLIAGGRTKTKTKHRTTPKSENVYLLLLVKVSSAPTRCARRSMPLPPPARAHSVRLSHAW